MTPIALQDRAQYLSLALFAQQVVSALIEYVDENNDQKLRPTLEEALNALKAAKTSSASPQRRAALTSYEQLRTLAEVWKPQDHAKAVDMIQVVLSEAGNRKAKPAANKLIGLFSKLQDQALWNFEQPRPVPLETMQKLCKLA